MSGLGLRTGRPGGAFRRGGGAERAERKELTQAQMMIGLVIGIVGAIVGTVVGLILLTIIVGLADGH